MQNTRGNKDNINESNTMEAGNRGKSTRGTKKSFKGNNPALAFISASEASEDSRDRKDSREGRDSKASKAGKAGAVNTLNASIAHDAYDAQDAHGVHNAQRTQGRKGQKLPRINMAFRPANLQYLGIISRIEGISMTEYTNRLIEEDMKVRKNIVDKAKEILGNK